MLHQYNRRIYKNKKGYIKLKNRETKKEKYSYDIGLAILRPILAFFVIMTHHYKFDEAKGKWKEIIINANYFNFHVPIFFIMSFYFSYNTLISSNYKKKFERLQRLFIPYFFYPIFVFFLNKLLLKYSITKNEIKLKHLKHQLLYGTGYIVVFWYQLDLIFITICFILIIFIFRKYCNLIFIIIAITAFIYQYNGKNRLFFSKYYDGRQHTFGKFLEIIPYTVTGFLISYSSIINYLKKHRLKTIIICIYIIYFISNYKVFNYVKGFDYNGVNLFLKSICIFFSFAMFPSEKIKNKILIKIIKQIISYTPGIIFLHIEVIAYISYYITSIKKRTVISCVIVYLISYLICFVGSLIFGKTKLRHLFE